MAGEKSIEIQTSEFVSYEKSHFWYVGMSIYLLAVLAVAYYYRDFLLVALIVAVAVALFRLANLQPRKLKMRITQKGVEINDSFLPWHKIRAYWVATGEQPFLHFELTGWRADKVLPISASKIEQVEDLLSIYLPRHEHRKLDSGERIRRLLRY